MSDTGGRQPPPPPGSAPPPGGAPLPGSAPPPAPPGWQGPPPAYAPRRTNALSIVSLVAGLAQFAVCPVVGTIVAIVTGHVARGQMRRTGEGGAGMATAGLVLGYIGVALTVFAGTALVVFALAFAPDLAQDEVRDNARDFAAAIEREATAMERPTRDALVIRRTYAEEHSDPDGCCDETSIRLADGTPVDVATEAALDRSGWQLEFKQWIFATKYACLTVPARGEPATVVEGRCPV